MLKTILWRAWLGVAVLLAAVGCWLLWGGYSMRQRVLRKARAVPASFAVDLSEPGTYSGEFSHTHGGIVGLELQVKLKPQFASHEEAKQALGGLQATFTIGEPDSESVVSETLSADEVDSSPWTRSLRPDLDRGLYFHIFRWPDRERKTRAVLTVENPAEGLNGRKQRLVIRYLLCGVEAAWPAILASMGGLLVLPGFVTGIIVLWRLYRRRSRGRDAV